MTDFSLVCEFNLSFCWCSTGLYFVLQLSTENKLTPSRFNAGFKHWLWIDPLQQWWREKSQEAFLAPCSRPDLLTPPFKNCSSHGFNSRSHGYITRRNSLQVIDFFEWVSFFSTTWQELQCTSGSILVTISVRLFDSPIVIVLSKINK